jgi:hypothetical protein
MIKFDRINETKFMLEFDQNDEYAKWVVGLVDYLVDHPQSIITGTLGLNKDKDTVRRTT